MRADAAPDLLEPPSLATLADRCVQCGLCLPHCPTYRLDGVESESPRGRIAYIKAVATGTIAPTETGDRHLDHCLGCRRCEAVCPADVEMERLLVGARAAQFERHRPDLAQRALLVALASPTLARLAFAAGRWTGKLPAKPPGPAIPDSLPIERNDRGRITLFEGCAGREYEAGTRGALATLLSRAGFDVVQVAGQGCCGTAAAHAGDAAGASRLGAANREALAGYGKVLSLATGCQSILAASLAGVADVEDALVFFDREAGSLRFRPSRGRVALHLPCSQRVLGGAESLRRLLARVPELDLVELSDTGCCGAAGLHQLAEPDRATRLRAPLLDALAASGAGELLSANIGCRLHLGNGAKIPVRHPIEFLAEHLA